ncbi:MAG: histidinol dehydrogenase [Candidatus Thermoplasmatota archaeon]
MAKDPIPQVRALDAAAWALADRAQDVPAQVVADARRIVAEVGTGGDKALREHTRRFDGCDLEDPFLTPAAWTRAAGTVAAPVRQAIDENLRRIQAFHGLQTGKAQRLQVAPGVVLGRRPVPYEAVACYVPGGRATYPSTALMTVTPARIAGCSQIIVATPPRPDGTVDPAVLYAAKKAGATHVLRAGGAQAIAALAYGTERVPRVQAIVGPGNAYVTAAKQQVASVGRVWTDAPAGPSELLVVADATADPARIALDLLAQAEHDPDAQVVLVATDRRIADAVRAELQDRLPHQSRGAIVAASLADKAALLVARDLDEALRFANAYAPEHLTLMVKAPAKALLRIRDAGSVFLGPNAPVSLGDYGSGTNHVLPTMGHARIRGGLSVEDFRKWVTWQDVTPAGLRRIGPAVATVARAEGLIAHAEAVEGRLASDAGLRGSREPSKNSEARVSRVSRKAPSKAGKR